jgi:peroxiredoxin
MRQTIGLMAGVAMIAFGAMAVLRGLGDERAGPIIDAGDPEYGLGTSFADLRFTDLDGNELDFTSFAAGRSVVVFVRDALCPVSRRYGPETARIASDYADQGVSALYLNVSPLDTPADMEEDVSRYGLGGTYAVDHEWDVARQLGVITTAEAFLFDSERKLRYRGAIDDQYGIRYTKPKPRSTYLRNALDELMGGEEVAVPSMPPEGCYLAAEVHDHEVEVEHTH